MIWYPETMGIFGLSVEEKIGGWMIDKYKPLGVDPFTSMSKGDAVRQVKVLLGMYQSGVLGDVVPVFNPDDSYNSEQVREYLLDRSDLAYSVIVAFTNGLYSLVQTGDIDLKHLNPAEAGTVAETTNIIKNAASAIENVTPTAIKSVFDADIPAMIQKNMVTLSAVTLGIAAIIYFTKSKGGNYGRFA